MMKTGGFINAAIAASSPMNQLSTFPRIAVTMSHTEKSVATSIEARQGIASSQSCST